MTFNRRGLKLNGHRRVGLGHVRGGFTRRRGWYRTNDIRTAVCDRDMEIWIPKNDRGYLREDVEEVWDV